MTEDRNIGKKAILKVNSLDGGYGKIQILYEISLSVAKEEIVTIIGPNGCGKSTFLKVLTGIANYFTGEISYFGYPIMDSKTSDLIKMGMSYVPQVDNVFPDLTIRENLELGAFLQEDNVDDHIEEIFSLFPDLYPRRHDFASKLSGGQRQMLALGRALMTRPRFLILDEPTAALSPSYVDMILEKITELRELGLTLLLVEQNAKSALSRSDYAYVFSSGKVVFHGEAQNILKDPELGRKFLGFVKAE